MLMGTKKKCKGKIEASEVLSRWRCLHREWLARIPDPEFKLLSFIADRTWGWGKDGEYISYSQMTGGVGDVSEGIGGTQRRAIRLTKSLKSLELIKVSPGGAKRKNTNYIEINMAKLRKPRRMQQGKKTEDCKGITSDKTVRPPSDNIVTQIYTNENTQRIPKGIPAGTGWDKPKSPDKEETKDAAEIVKDAAAKSQKLRRKRLSRMTAPALKDAWSDIVSAAYPEEALLSFTGGHVHALKAKAAKWVKAHKSRSNDDFLEFLTWSVDAWYLVLSIAFFGLQAKPKYPSLPFFVKFFDKFEGEYAQQTEYAQLATMTDDERKVYFMVRKGMDRESAENLVEKSKPKGLRKGKRKKVRADIDLDAYHEERAKIVAQRKAQVDSRKHLQSEDVGGHIPSWDEIHSEDAK